MSGQHPSRRNFLKLTGGVSAAMTLGAGGVLAAAAPASASDLGGPITRNEVIQRARIWVDQAPPYSQQVYIPGPGGDHRYRTDCSGFVIMAWHFDGDASTRSLPDISYEISRDELRAGDILNSYYDHVFLFHEWVDDHGGFRYYSFGGGASGVEPPGYFTANIYDATLDGHPNGDYKARRYHHIIEDGAPSAVQHPYMSGRVVSGRSADGRLELFAAGGDGVHHAWQTAVNGGWSAWENLGGPRGAQLAIAPNADGRLELFALSGTTFDHIWQTAPNAGWSGWANFGTGGYRVAVGNNADGRIEVFASNSSGVFHRWQSAPSSGWADWAGAGGPANSRLAMETAPDGRLEVFALSDSTFEHLFQTAPSGGWSAWENFGTGGREVTVQHNSDGRLEVFASNSSGVFHRWQSSPTTWSDWVGTGGPANAKLSCARTPDGRVEVFAMSDRTAAHIWQLGENQPYSDWETFGGPGTSVTATNNADGRIEVFGTNSTGVYHRWQTGATTWADWAPVNGPGPSMP
ncbi:twin-arginine translocation signal domain-containing protein [Streptomyces sp. KLOTTS4A1]|uniref:twin-arginine translocation signal domain-containing protein n=1 Tax=Streptomyces sp. KLOTTS4A1 TaxID=3390996 RepID=UPI0039F4AA96